MKKLFFILATILAFSACSKDDDNNGGTNGGGNGSGSNTGGSSMTNPAKRNSIPGDQLTGKWVFDKRYYTIEADDATTRKKIENDILYGTSKSLYLNTGLIKFYTGAGQTAIGLPGMFAEGSIRYNYQDTSDNVQLFGDYFSSNDTIYYYHHSLKRKYAYMLKKGDRLIYHYDSTKNFQGDFPNGGVKKVIYYAEYARKNK